MAKLKLKLVNLQATKVGPFTSAARIVNLTFDNIVLE